MIAALICNQMICFRKLLSLLACGNALRLWLRLVAGDDHAAVAGCVCGRGRGGVRGATGANCESHYAQRSLLAKGVS